MKINIRIKKKVEKKDRGSGGVVVCFASGRASAPEGSGTGHSLTGVALSDTASLLKVYASSWKMAASAEPNSTAAEKVR